MQFIAAAILGVLLRGAKSLVGKVLLAMGLGFTVYAGMDTAFTWAENTIKQNFGALPAKILQILSVCQVDTAISIVLSAYAVRMMISGVVAGGLRKLGTKTTP